MGATDVLNVSENIDDISMIVPETPAREIVRVFKITIESFII